MRQICFVFIFFLSTKSSHAQNILLRRYQDPVNVDDSTEFFAIMRKSYIVWGGLFKKRTQIKLGRLNINQNRYSIPIRYIYFLIFAYSTLPLFAENKKYADAIKNTGTAHLPSSSHADWTSPKLSKTAICIVKIMILPINFNKSIPCFSLLISCLFPSFSSVVQKF